MLDGTRSTQEPGGIESASEPAPVLTRVGQARPALIHALAGTGLVERPRLRDRLLASADSPLVVLEAPAGYSKTTTLTDWDAADRRPFVWVTCRPWHRDPAVLVEATIGALEQITPIDPGVLLALSSPAPAPSVVLARLQSAVAAITPSFVLVVDDAHMLTSPESFEVLEAILTSLPGGSQLAVGTRSHPALRLGRTRAGRGLLELGTGDLAMTHRESEALLKGTGLDLTPAQADMIFERSEGWPAALYLAGRVLSGQESLEDAIEAFSGDDRVMVEYFSDEFLSGLTGGQVDFLVRSSVLNELSGPLLDFVLERTDSALLLKHLAGMNALVLPLDRTGGRFRLHHLFSDMLRSELRRRDPGAEGDLHMRASRWFQSQGDLASAAEHAVASGDAGFAGEAIWRALPEMASRGRVATLERWLGACEDFQGDPGADLILASAHLHLVRGDGAGAATRADILRSSIDLEETGVRRARGDLHLLEATICRKGVENMGRDAERAAELLDPASAWQSPCLLYSGVSRHLTGDAEGAVADLRESARLGASAAPIIQVLSLAQLALISIEDGELESAARAISHALDQVLRCGLEDLPPVANVFAVHALSRSLAGQSEKARESAATALKLLDTMVDFPSWYEAEARIALARTSLQLGDIEGARRRLAEAEIPVGRVADSPALRTWLDDTSEQLGSAGPEPLPGAPSLTAAELRTLQYLPTHHSFQEIGRILHLSRNTVKTQAGAVYRKLGATSRTEAVQLAREAGLISSGSQAPGA